MGQDHQEIGQQKVLSYLELKLVIAESFERIHRSNLVGMGILPLEFTQGMDRHKLNLKGSELVTVLGIEKGVKSKNKLSK